MSFVLKNLEKSVLILLLVVALMASSVAFVYASSTSEFQITINEGTLAVDIVNASEVTVGSPSVAFSAQTFSFSCGSAPGTFGTASEKIYVTNPDAADAGWTVSLAATASTSLWTSTASSSDQFDFNDSFTAGCVDSGNATDSDSVAGQLTLTPSAGTLATVNCASCTTTGVSKGSADSFEQGGTDSITILSASGASDDIGDWELTGVTASQTIPAEQNAHNDYTLDMTLSIVAT